jgi:polyisoprenoid-binding protein YceI
MSPAHLKTEENKESVMRNQVAAAFALSTLGVAEVGAAVPATTPAPAAWQIDTAHSSAQFKVRHLMVSNVRGALGPVTGSVHIDEADLTRSYVTVAIDARALDSKDPKRDEHLRSVEFLDVARYPSITFRSQAVRPRKDGGLDVTGDLTIRGVTRSVKLAVDPLPSVVKDPWGNTKRGAVARATLNRKDFGLVWNMALETGGVLVGDRVEVEIEVELVKRTTPSNGA